MSNYFSAESWDDFHFFEVNSFMDMRYRRHKRVRRLEPFFFLEDIGQGMHIRTLKHVKLVSGKGNKCVWHRLAQKTDAT